MRASRHAGFTLIEVLITLVILSTGIVVVLQAFQTSAAALGAARDMMRATHLARATLETIARDGLAWAPTAYNPCLPPYTAYEYRVTAEDVTGADGNPKVIMVEVRPRSSPDAVFSLPTYWSER